MPRDLSPGILYLAEEYAVAGHLCACGCGNKVMTPLGAAEWNFSERDGRPSLSPSIGNWQLPCQSHYFITGGKIYWAAQWSTTQVEEGRQAEEQRRRAHYASRDRKLPFWMRIRQVVRNIFGK
jgi:hypothetical protein